MVTQAITQNGGLNNTYYLQLDFIIRWVLFEIRRKVEKASALVPFSIQKRKKKGFGFHFGSVKARQGK